MARDDTFRSLLRAITLSAGDFSLLLARCNSAARQKQIIADLRQTLETELCLVQVQPSEGAVNVVDRLEDVASANCGVVCVTGLERSPYLDDILAIANNAREEYRKRLSFPVVFWVTDDVETRLRRQSPDFASWAAPTFAFELSLAELRDRLDQGTATTVNQALGDLSAHQSPHELRNIWREWQRRGESLSSELKARVALAFGLDAATDEEAQDWLEQCLECHDAGEVGAAANFRLGLWWEWQGKLNRAEFLDKCDRAKDYLQKAWDGLTEHDRSPVAPALGRVLLALALPEDQDSIRWQEVNSFATQLGTHSALAHGLWAEVALVGEDFQVGEREVRQAIELSPEPEGLYGLALGRSQLGLGDTAAAVTTLEEAKELVAAEVDPDLHIRILRALHGAYRADGDDQAAFVVKCDRAAVETEFGFRAFIGAGRLRPRQRLGAIGEAATEEIAASGRQEDIDALVGRVKRNDCRLTVIHGPSGVGKSSLIRAGLVPALRQTIHQSRRVMPVVLEHYENWQDELAEQLEQGRTQNPPELGGRLRREPSAERGANTGSSASSSSPEEGSESGERPLNPPSLGDFETSVITPEGAKTQNPPELGGRGANAESRASSSNLEEGSESGERPLNPPSLGDFEAPAPAQLIAQLQENDRNNLVTVLIFDQFEEFFFKHPELPGRRELYTFLRDCLEVGYVWIFLSLREDYLHYLLECDRLANLTLINNDILNKNVRYYLGNFPEERAKKVIRELTESSPYRLQPELIDRLASDLAADLGEVRPIEMQVVGAEMLHSEDKITSLAQYNALETPPKKRLVERWLAQVVRDCGNDNQELAQRTLVALTEEPEKRPVKSWGELSREVRLRSSEMPPEEQDFAVDGDLAFVLQVLLGSGLGFEIPASPEVGYQLIHDYLVLPIRQQFGGKLAKQLAEERQKRQVAEANVKKRNRWLLQGSITAAIVFLGLSIVSVLFASQANEQRVRSDRNALNTKAVADSLIWKGLMATGSYQIDEQITLIEKTKKWQQNLEHLREENRLELTATILHATRLRREKNRYETHQDSVSSVAFSPDGQSILTGSWDNTVKLWSLDGRELQSFQGHQDSISSVAFSPDGQSILTGSWDKTAKLWSLDGRELQSFQGHQDSISSVAFSPDGQSILTGSRDKTVKLWGLDGRELQSFQGHQNSISSIAFSPNGQSILTGSEDTTVKLWSLGGRELQSFEGHQDSISSVAFSPDGQSILTGSWDNTAKLWSLNGRELQSFQGHQSVIVSVAFSPDGQSILTGSWDNTAKLWSLNGRELQSFQGHQSFVVSVAFSPDGQSILTGSRDNTAKLWSLNGRELQSFQGHQDSVSSVAFSPDGQSILTGSWDDTAKLWSLDGRELQSFQGHQGSVTSVAFSPDGQSILTGSWDDTAKLWSLDGRELQSFQGHQDEVLSVAFSPDGQSILTGSRDNTAKLWSLDGRALQLFQGHQNSVNSVVFSPDEQSLLTSSEDTMVKLWSLDGRELQSFQGHQSFVVSVAFSPDGQSILAASEDTMVKLWSLDGRELQSLQGHQDSISSVAFSPDGQSILIGSRDNTAKLWSLDLNYLLKLNCDFLANFSKRRDTFLLHSLLSSLRPQGSQALRKKAYDVCRRIPPPKLKKA